MFIKMKRALLRLRVTHMTGREATEQKLLNKFIKWDVGIPIFLRVKIQE